MAEQSASTPDAPVHADAGGGLRTQAPEICGNGIDDNGNGAIDEGCSCGAGETQACWPGPAKDRHRGSCKDGLQTCVGSGEFHSWGTCVGAELNCDLPMAAPDGPVAPVDARLPDAKHVDAPLPPHYDAPPPPPDAHPHYDARPHVDARPPDARPPDARPPDAPPAPICEPEPFEFCTDGIDNDCDGLVDCDDPDCQSTAFCTCTSETCEPGTQRFCDGPVFCNWGVQTCGPDRAWGKCVEDNTHPPGCDGQLYDWVCCKDSGACCQSPFDGSSVGTCPGVVKTCQRS